MKFVQLFGIVLSLTLVVADVGNKVSFQPRITNGIQAPLGQFPWHALLAIQYNNDNRVTYWNGVILNNLWILTNADAVVNARTIRADIGHVVSSYPALTVYPDSYTIHPQFNQNNFVNNLALVRMPLNRPIQFPDGPNPPFAPIRLPTLRQQYALFEDSEAYFSGWGFVRQNDFNMSQSLMFSDQKVIRNQECLQYYGNDVQLISPNVICSLSLIANQGPCNGDGGAPLVINEYGTFTLIGTLSFLHSTASCGRQPAPTVFTRITSHFDWIARTTGYQFRP